MYPKSFKDSIIREIKRGIKSQRQISEETGIPATTLSRWKNNTKENRYKKAFVAPSEKDYSEMRFDELLNHLPSKENKDFATYLNRQYKDKGIALRYCLIILKPLGNN
jgi:transposase-like protein